MGTCNGKSNGNSINYRETFLLLFQRFCCFSYGCYDIQGIKSTRKHPSTHPTAAIHHVHPHRLYSCMHKPKYNYSSLMAKNMEISITSTITVYRTVVHLPTHTHTNKHTHIRTDKHSNESLHLVLLYATVISFFYAQQLGKSERRSLLLFRNDSVKILPYRIG